MEQIRDGIALVPSIVSWFRSRPGVGASSRKVPRIEAVRASGSAIPMSNPTAAILIARYTETTDSGRLVAGDIPIGIEIPVCGKIA